MRRLFFLGVLLLWSGAAAAASPDVSTATQGIVIYATNSAIIRQIIIPDTDADIGKYGPGSGESSLVISKGTVDSGLDAVKAAVQAATGKAPPSGRSVIVDKTTHLVTGSCQADPAIDTAFDSTSLVASDIAGNGDQYIGGVFLREFAIVDSITRVVGSFAFIAIPNPIAPLGTFLVGRGSLKIGDVIPLKPPITVVVGSPQ